MYRSRHVSRPANKRQQMSFFRWMMFRRAEGLSLGAGMQKKKKNPPLFHRWHVAMLTRDVFCQDSCQHSLLPPCSHSLPATNTRARAKHKRTQLCNVARFTVTQVPGMVKLLEYKRQSFVLTKPPLPVRPGMLRSMPLVGGWSRLF